MKLKKVFEYQNMPEGPEVALMADQIQILLGTYFYSVMIKHNSKYQEFEKLILPQQITMIFAKGKKLVILMTRQALIISPLMTGKLLWKEGKHTQAILNFIAEDLKTAYDLYFDDKRTIALINVIEADKLSEHLYNKVGLDWLHDDIPYAIFKKTLKRRRIPIGKFLIDQHAFCGIGNYLRAEILYAAQINPHTPTRNLTDDQIEILYKFIKTIIREAYFHKGLTISDYLTPNSEKGTYEPKCYGRKIDDNNQPVKYEKLGTQFIYWVPSLQK